MANVMLAALDIHIPYHGKLLLGTSFLLRMSVSLSVSLYFGQSLSPGLSLLAPSLRKTYIVIKPLST